jgi:hypothetical protein
MAGKGLIGAAAKGSAKIAAKNVDEVAEAAETLLDRGRRILGDRPLNSGSLDELYQVGKLSMDEARALAKSVEWKDDTGKWIYPPNDGFEGVITKGALNPPSKMDRYGGWIDKTTGKFNDTGNFFSPASSSYGSRALPPGTDSSKQFVKYQVMKPIEVQSGKITAWFGEPGGGTQHMSSKKVFELIEQGNIKPIK